jgi:UDP-glucose 4-epimerase
VRSIASIYQKLIEHQPLYSAVNLCSGVTYSLKEIIDMVALITNHQINIKINPNLVRTNEVQKLSGDTNKIKSILSGIEFTNLKDTLSWMSLES